MTEAQQFNHSVSIMEGEIPGPAAFSDRSLDSVRVGRVSEVDFETVYAEKSVGKPSEHSTPVSFGARGGRFPDRAS